MKHKELLELLDKIEEKPPQLPKNNRILIIDGLNLFFRSFTILNILNYNGEHIGGLGGFFRSLGFLINHIQPDEVYVIFDGEGSTISKKNIIPEYKAKRNITRITNWEAFDDLNGEDNSKISQIVRVIQYLKTLPIKTLAFPKTEADDIIAYLSYNLAKKSTNKIFIASADKDFIQLIKENIIIFNPLNREFCTEDLIKDRYKISPQNFLLYKTLLGDNSDNIQGIKGLGEKGIIKKFPELGEKILTLEDVFEISKNKFKDHIVYSRIIQSKKDLEKSYKIMDLSNPMIDDKTKNLIKDKIKEQTQKFYPDLFLSMSEEDGLEKIIRNIKFWIRETFKTLEK